MAFSVMVGSGETYLPAFALAVGIGEIEAGLVASAPLLAGALLQLISPAAVRRLGSHRKWVVTCALVQALSFLPLILAALWGAIPVWGLFAAATLYWAAGLATGPAWNTWVGSLVPRGLRAGFFAARSRWAQLATICGLLGGGLVLQFVPHATRIAGGDAIRIIFPGFAIIFAVAAISRCISAGFLASQREVAALPKAHRHVSPRELMKRLRGSGDMRLLLYLLAVTLTVHISGPFCAPYLLSELDFSYSQYFMHLAGSYVTKAALLPTFGALGRRLGPLKLLWMGGIGIVPLPFLWAVAPSFWWLLAVQVLSGAVWAAYELAGFLLLFDHIREDERTSILTTYNVLHAVAMLAGSLVGAQLLHAWNADYHAYVMLFTIATGLRLLTLLFLRKIAAMDVRSEAPAFRTIAVRPAMGSLDRPILAGFRPEPPENAQRPHAQKPPPHNPQPHKPHARTPSSEPIEEAR